MVLLWWLLSCCLVGCCKVTFMFLVFFVVLLLWLTSCNLAQTSDVARDIIIGLEGTLFKLVVKGRCLF